MVRILLVLLVMITLFLGGVLTGMNQTGNEQTVAENSPPAPSVQAHADEPVAGIPQEQSSSSHVQKDGEPPETEAVYMTQKVAVGLEAVIAGVCNLFIQSIHQLVKVFFL